MPKTGKMCIRDRFLYHQSCQLQAVNSGIRVNTSFKTERSVCVQRMATGCLAHPCGMEVSTFKEYIFGGFRRTGIQTAEHTGNKPVSYTHLDVYKRQGILHLYGMALDGDTSFLLKVHVIQHLSVSYLYSCLLYTSCSLCGMPMPVSST